MTNNVRVNSLQKFKKVLNIAPDRDDSKSDTTLKTEPEEPREEQVPIRVLLIQKRAIRNWAD